MDTNELWAYRARSTDDLVPVRLIREGSGKPARVLVRFEDPAMEGREAWVPPARLKVLWSGADAYLAQEARWAAVWDRAPDRDAADLTASLEVWELLVPSAVAELHWKGGYLTIHDVDALTALTGSPVEALTGDDAVFIDADCIIVPWPAALRVAETLARRNARAILSHVDDEERRFQRRAIWGEVTSGRSATTIEPEIIIELDNQLYRPARELLRGWCGQAADRWDELIELRKEIRRVGEIAELAIAALHAAGSVRAADQLAITLGQTVEMLRADRTTPR